MTTRTKTAIGLSMLFALALCAFAAPGASAQGTTLFNCRKEVGVTNQFSDEHCDEKSTEGNGFYEHSEISASVAQKIEGTNAKTTGLTTQSTAAMLSTPVAGIAVTITCSGVSSKGTVENQLGFPMRVAGTGIVVTYTGCKVTAPLNAKKEEICQIKGGEIKTNELTSETVINGTEMGVKFTPKTGTKVAEIMLENKAPEACTIIVPIEVRGTLTGTGASNTGGGATLTFTEQMTSSTLTVNFQKASYAATETLKLEGGNPVALTTTAT